MTEGLTRRLAYSWRDIALAAASIALVVGLFWLVQWYTGPVWAEAESLDALAGWFGGFEVEGVTLDLPPADVRQLATEGYGAARDCVTYLAGSGFSALTLIVLVASALLALGTNTVCFRQARLRH